MNMKTSRFQTKHIEESISCVGAKIADALELSKKAKEMTIGSEAVLLAAQQKLEKLYLSLDDICVDSDELTKE